MSSNNGVINKRKAKRYFRKLRCRRQKASMAGCDQVVYDQNHVTHLSNSTKYESTFNDELKVRGFDLHNPYISQFNLLEMLGFNQLPKVSIPSIPGVAEAQSYDEAQAIVFQHYLKKAYEIPFLYSERLIEEAKLRLKNSRTETGRLIYQGLQKFILLKRENIRDHLCKAIAVDRMSAYQYPRKLTKQMMNYLPRDILTLVGEGYPFNFVRMMIPLLEDMQRQKRFRGEKLESLELRKHLEEMDLSSPNKDLLDTSIVHFAVVGIVEANCHYRAHVFTCDPIETVKARLVPYKGLYSRAYELLSERKGELSYSIRGAKPGVISFCDPETGKIIEAIDLRLDSSI